MSEKTVEIKTCEPITIVTDVRVVAEFPYITKWWNTPGGLPEVMKRYAKELQGEVSDFEDFIKDHRSQDGLRLSVENVTQLSCSACFEEWEEDEDGDGRFCASCGVRVQPTG